MDPEPASHLLLLFFEAPQIFLISSLLQVSIGLIGLSLLLFFSAVISGSEVAFFSLTLNDYEKLEQEEDRSSRRILWLKDRPRKLLATILICNNFINIAIVLLSEILVAALIPASTTTFWAQGLQQSITWLQRWTDVHIATVIHFLITVVGATFLLVLFGEVAPKVYARFNRVQLARFMSGPLSALMQFFSPLSALLVLWSNRLEKRFQDKSPAASKEDIGEAIKMTVSREDDSEQELDILKRIVKFSEVIVRQIMRSRMDVVALDMTSNYAEVLSTIRESGYSRFPVYENDTDHVAGILYVKDLLMHLEQGADFAWIELMRPNVLFVPETKKISDLLKEFQTEHLHMAIVVDEYGGTLGIATLEDVLEEVIGDIKDEFDDGPEVIYRKIDDYNFVFDGKTMLNDAYRILNLETDPFDEAKGEADSLAGLVLELLGELPQADEEIFLDGYKFKVIAVSDRRIEEIWVTLPSGED